MRLRDLTAEMVNVDEIPELAALSNDRKRNFVIFYVSNGGNGAAAAREAGYAEKTANRNGGTFARDPKIKAAIMALREWFFGNQIMSKNEALARLSLMARGELGHVLDDSGNINAKMIKDSGQLIESYNVKHTKTEKGTSFSRTVKMNSAKAAIVELAKIQGFYREDSSVKVGNVEYHFNI